MQFSDATNKNGLVQDIDFICGTDNTSYPIEDKTRNINEELYGVGVLMWRYSPLWAFDDNNQTTLPILTTNLVEGQKDYGLETNILHIERVSVKDANGLWSDLEFLPFSDIPQPIDEFYKTNGIPRIYSLKGNSLFLLPAPRAADVTLTNGLKMVISRIADGVKFVSTDTTKTPGFNPAYHRILSLGASLAYLMVNNPDLYNRVKSEYAELKNSFVDWLRNRQLPRRRPILSPRKECYE